MTGTHLHIILLTPTRKARGACLLSSRARARRPLLGHRAAAALACATWIAAPAHAQLAACSAIPDDRARLACYDALARAQPAPTAQAPASAPASAQAPSQEQAPASAQAPATAQATPTPSASSTNAASAQASASAATELERAWDLRPGLRRGTFELRPYRPLFALAHYTTSTNPTPGSPTRSVAEQDIHLDPLEAKMQLSLKSKLAEDILGSATDLWFGYTQQSYWQAANSRYSSPFRETDYEPEVILMHALDAELGGVAARYASLSLTHQSNGRGESLSRSWNRVIGEVAAESGSWAVHLRPWVRIHERHGAQDDNPDIDDFAGRGEASAVYRAGGHVVTLTGRHSLRGGARSHGSAQVDWAFPLTGSLNGHLQIFSGYGENLIDYNHRQTTFGFGVSFFD